MTEEINRAIPASYKDIDEATRQSGFTMPSDILTCSLLKTLAATKPGGKFLELGTGTGLSTAWILDGMDKKSSLVSVDYDDQFLTIARQFLGFDNRLTLELADGETWVLKNEGQKFDYIFADTWHGKYLMLDEVLSMLNPGGLYIIDDMMPQPNWPEGHDQRAINLVRELESKPDLVLTRQVWATGIIIAAKRNIG